MTAITPPPPPTPPLNGSHPHRAVCDNTHRDRARWGHDPRGRPRSLVLGGWDRHRDVSLPTGPFNVASSLTLASFRRAWQFRVSITATVAGTWS